MDEFSDDDINAAARIACQADVTFSRDNLSHREQTEPMPQQYSDP